MPRPNRFNPTFAQRLQQSRVSRGQEPAEVPTDWGSVYAEFAGDITHYRRLFMQDPDDFPSRDMGRAIHEMAAALRLHEPLTGRIGRLSIMDELDAIPALSIEPPPIRWDIAEHVKPAQEKPKVERQPQTEQTLLTALQQGVADAVSLIQQFAGLQEVHTLGFPALPSSHLTPIHMFNSWVSLSLSHTNQIGWADQTHPTCHTDNYPNRKTLYIRPIVARHRAVINALADMLAKLPSEVAESGNAALAALEKTAIDDLEAHLADLNRVYQLRFSPGTSGDKAHLPGLGVTIYQIDVAATSAPGVVNFDYLTPLWKVREQARLLRGEYSPLPPEIADLLPAEVVETQYPHLACKPGNAGMIAYTQSPIAGQLDRQQVIKAGRYLRQHCPDLSDEQIKQASAVITAAFAAGIHHSSDEMEFERVYRKGPSSCMAYGPNDKSWGRLTVNGSFFHPARVYAHPQNDIEIVWLEIDGRIGARAVVNTKTKQYPRLYASDSVAGAGPRLRAYLENLGYTVDDGALCDQVIRRVAPDCDSSAIICPYIDSGNQGVEVFPNHLVIGGGYEADHETGCLESYNVSSYDWTCDVCDNGYSDEEDPNETNDHDQVCNHCVERHYTHAYDPDSDGYRYVDDSECFYTDRTSYTHGRTVWVGNGMGDYVHLSDDYYCDEVAHIHQCVLTEDDEYILERDTSDLGYFDGGDGEWLLIEDYAVLDDELVKRSEVPDDAELLPLSTDSDYPELPVYQSAEEDESAQEDAA